MSATHTESQDQIVNKRIGARVRELRKGPDFDQREMAKAIGVTQGQFSRLEAGANWSAAQVWAACQKLGCKPSDLMDAAPPSTVEASIVEAIRAGDFAGALEAITKAMRRTGGR